MGKLMVAIVALVALAFVGVAVVRAGQALYGAAEQVGKVLKAPPR